MNTDLKVADGVVVPEAATLDVRFSAGGAGPMLTVVKDGRSPAGFTVAAWVRLPAPEPADGGEEPGEQPGEGTEPGAGEGDDPEGGGTPSDEEQGEETSSLPTSNQVAVSQDGRNASMFRLGYRADLDLDGDAVKDPAWCFTVKAQDLSTAGSIDACTTSYVEAGAWVHLVGIVNPVTNRIQLYVNGIPARDGVFSNRRT